MVIGIHFRIVIEDSTSLSSSKAHQPNLVYHITHTPMINLRWSNSWTSLNCNTFCCVTMWRWAPIRNTPSLVIGVIGQSRRTVRETVVQVWLRKQESVWISELILIAIKVNEFLSSFVQLLFCSSNCIGPSRKHYSCNIEDCDPNEIDFRERQCLEFDNQPFKGRYFNWIPYWQAPNPCELNCMPKGERFYYRHAEKVIDGTKCYNDGSLDICVDGQCMVCRLAGWRLTFWTYFLSFLSTHLAGWMWQDTWFNEKRRSMRCLWRRWIHM